MKALAGDLPCTVERTAMIAVVVEGNNFNST